MIVRTVAMGIGIALFAFVCAAQAECVQLDQRPCVGCHAVERGQEAVPPIFSEADVRASRSVHHQPASLASTVLPAFQGVDMMNLFVVIETAGQHVTLLDGDRLTPIHRFANRKPLAGAPRFTPDGRYAFFLSLDGWVTKFDIWSLQVVAEIRVGTHARNLTLSGDGKYLALANQQPDTLVLLDADLNLLKVLAVKDKDAKLGSRVSAVCTAAARKSFVVVLTDVAEVWELSYEPGAEDIAVGMVHDFKYQEGAFVRGFLNPRRTILASPLDGFIFTQSYDEVIGISRTTPSGQVINLDARRKIADLNLPRMTHPVSGATWAWQGRTVVAVSGSEDGPVALMDPSDWSVIKTLRLQGTGFSFVSHESAPFVWVGSTTGEGKDSVQVIDKRTLERVAVIPFDHGKTLTHLAFNRMGTSIVASLSHASTGAGELIVFDAATLKAVKRLPMDKPLGAYTLFNSIHPVAGASQ